MSTLKYQKLNQSEITAKQFMEIMRVENSSDSGYEEHIMRQMWIDENKNDNFVCILDNKIIAHATFNPSSKRRNGSIYMVNLTVHPDHRKKGIAMGLILEACNYYLNHGATLPVSTSVDKTNTPAINLYKKVGFKIEEPICELDEDD